jgi:hypothetical protein
MTVFELIEANGLNLHGDIEHFANLVEAHDRDAIMKSIDELRPVENNPLLQNKPAAFWIQNFKQIVYARGTT